VIVSACFGKQLPTLPTSTVTVFYGARLYHQSVNFCNAYLFLCRVLVFEHFSSIITTCSTPSLLVEKAVYCLLTQCTLSRTTFSFTFYSGTSVMNSILGIYFLEHSSMRREVLSALQLLDSSQLPSAVSSVMCDTIASAAIYILQHYASAFDSSTSCEQCIASMNIPIKEGDSPTNMDPRSTVSQEATAFDHVDDGSSLSSQFWTVLLKFFEQAADYSSTIQPAFDALTSFVGVIGVETGEQEEEENAHTPRPNQLMNISPLNFIQLTKSV